MNLAMPELRGKRWLSAKTVTIIFIVASCLALIATQFVQIIRHRSEVIANGRKETSNLTGSLVQHAELTFRNADALLTATIFWLARSQLSPEVTANINDFLTEQVKHSAVFVSFAIVDAQGRMIANTTADGGSSQFSDRDYFKFHQNNPSEEMRIGGPVRGRATTGWLIPVTRRFNSPDGSFGGVAVAAVNPAYFQKFYDQFEVGKRGAILLASLNAKLLVRRPFVEANVGRDMADSNVFRLMKTASAGSAEISAATDGAARLNSYQVGTEYPIVVSVGVQMDELLATWRMDTKRRIIQTLIIVLVLALLGWFVSRSTGRLASNEQQLRNSNERFDAAMNLMSQGVCLYDAAQRIVVANKNYAAIYGLSAGEVRAGTDLAEVLRRRRAKGTGFLTPDEYFLEADAEDSTQSHNLPDGRIISINRHMMHDGGWLAVHEDITLRANAEREIAYLAGHDQLTGLPNRHQFSQYLDQLKKQRRRTDDRTAIFMLDLDGFKGVNDTLGHAVGDKLLVLVAQTLTSCLRETDFIARFGGDEFVIVQRVDVARQDAVASLATRIIQQVSQPADIDGYPVNIGVSIGVCLSQTHGTDFSDALKKADLALYETKAAGKNQFRIFQDEVLSN
jgi:diguanylate cyclase (GGDEF)-like protein